jgi:hypothetical protein
MIVRMLVRDRVMRTLFVLAQRPKSVGKKIGRSGSILAPIQDASTPIKSIATPDSRVRSEFIAELRARDTLRTVAITSEGKSHEASLHTAVSSEMLSAIESQDSSVSFWHRDVRIASTCCLKTETDSICAKGQKRPTATSNIEHFTLVTTIVQGEWVLITWSCSF